MYCTNCGTKNEDDAKFCAGCGQPLKHVDNDSLKEVNDNSKTVKSKKPLVIGIALAAVAVIVVVVILIAVSGGGMTGSSTKNTNASQVEDIDRGKSNGRGVVKAFEEGISEHREKNQKKEKEYAGKKE